MKVIGAGFERTETMSLEVALQESGRGPCFRGLESSMSSDTGRGHPRWERLAGGEVGDFDRQEALCGPSTTVGWRGARSHQELMDVFPDA